MHKPKIFDHLKIIDFYSASTLTKIKISVILYNKEIR